MPQVGWYWHLWMLLGKDRWQREHSVQSEHTCLDHIFLALGFIYQVPHKHHGSWINIQWTGTEVLTLKRFHLRRVHFNWRKHADPWRHPQYSWGYKRWRHRQSAKVNVYTLESKVATHLGSKDALDFLTEYLDAHDQHLGIDQVGLYVDFLWDQNWNVVLGFYSI